MFITDLLPILSLKPFPFYSRKAIYLDSIAGFCAGFFGGGLMSFLPVVALKLGAEPYQVAILISAPFVGSVLTPVWAHYTAGKEKVQFVVWPGIVSRGLFFLSFFIMTATQLVWLSVASFILISIATPAYVGLMKDIYQDKYRARSLAYVRVFAALGTIISSFIFGYLLDFKDGYRYFFPVAAVFGVLSPLIFNKIKVRQEKVWVTKNKLFNLNEFIKKIVSNKRITSYQMLFFLIGTGNFLIAPLIPLLMVDNLSLTNTEIGRLSAWSSLVMLVCYYVWGNYIDKKGPMKAVFYQILLFAIVPVIYFFANSYWVLFITSAITSISFAGIELANTSYITSVCPEEILQEQTAFGQVLLGVRGLLMPSLSIQLMNVIGMRSTFLVAASLVVAGYLFYLRYRKKYGLN
jgi:MFS family permease